MSCDILIKSYKHDFPFLKYALKSIAKNCEKFRDLILVFDEGDEQDVALMDFKEFEEGFGKRPKIYFEPVKCDGYLNQQIIKMYADKYSDADYFLFTDSDTVITRHCMPESFMYTVGMPYAFMTPYTSLKGAVPWQKVTEEVLGFKIGFEFMRRQPFLFHRSTLIKCRQYLEKIKGKPLDKYISTRPNRDFSEYNVLGAWAHLFENRKYYFVHTEIGPMPPVYAKQFWSRSGFTPQVQEEMEALTA